MSVRRETEVLIVGAGPVGLFTALALAARGIDVTIVDRESRGAEHSYALVLHSRTLELLDGLGLAGRLVERGYKVERVAFHDGRDRCAELDLSALGGRFPFILVLSQSALESVLREGLEEKSVRIAWNHRVSGLQPIPDAVSAEIAELERTAGGYPILQMRWVTSKVHKTRASIVVGADGFHSFTRETAGIVWGTLGRPQSFGLVEFTSDFEPRHESHVVLAKEFTSLLWPLGGGRFRFSFEIDDPAKFDPTPEKLRELARERAPWFVSSVGDVSWTPTVTFERRLTERFGKGRIWLAGDAAHLTGPAGGQSMNVGLKEGHDLAGRLADIVRGKTPVSALESYDAERLAEWRSLLSIDPRLKPLSSASDWVRERAARILPCVPASGEPLKRLLAQIGLELS